MFTCPGDLGSVGAVLAVPDEHLGQAGGHTHHHHHHHGLQHSKKGNPKEIQGRPQYFYRAEATRSGANRGPYPSPLASLRTSEQDRLSSIADLEPL